MQDEAKRIAATILQQLGGRRFIAMTGSSHFTATGNGLRFKVGRNSGRVTHVDIQLNAMDLYDVEFFRMDRKKNKALSFPGYTHWDYSKKTVKTYSDVYFDSLQSIFTDVTGLYTSL